MDICENIKTVRAKIEEARAKAGRVSEEIRLIAVSKKKPAEVVEKALACGHRDFGENIPQELREKADIFRDKRPNWHFIGHLQRNKIKYVLPNAVMIHSVDSLRLAEAMENWLEKHQAEGRKDILIQIRTAKEETKHGIAADEFYGQAERWLSFSRLRVCGVMTIATNTDDEKEIRRCFTEAREFFEKLKRDYFPDEHFKWISMGMSHDYPLAIEEGANMIRVGSAIFGARY